jgi:hypothetical protein
MSIVLPKRFYSKIVSIDEHRCRKVPQMLHRMASAMVGKPLLMTTFCQVSSIVLHLQHPIFKSFMETLLDHSIDIECNVPNTVNNGISFAISGKWMVKG